MSWLLLLLACRASPNLGGDSAAAVCNDGPCEPSVLGLSGDYVPYGWCGTVAEEASRIEGSWACRSIDGQLEDVDMTMTVSASDTTEVRRTTIDVQGHCIEVMSYPVVLGFQSDLFSTSIPTFAEILHEEDGDRTIVYDGLLSLHDIEGTLFQDLEYHPEIDVFSRDPIGTPRQLWRVNLGSFSEAQWYFECGGEG